MLIGLLHQSFQCVFVSQRCGLFGVPAVEQQRMAKRIAELEALLERQTTLLERQTARIVDLQTHIENFDGEDR